MILLKDGVSYLEYEYRRESELEKMVVDGATTQYPLLSEKSKTFGYRQIRAKIL